MFGLLPTAPAQAATPYCGITWGSTAKTGTDTGTTLDTLYNIRTGRHDCYDRMVFDLNGAGYGYDVRYVSNVYTDGEGALVPLTGGAKLRIVVNAASYNPNTGAIIYPGIAGKKLPGVDLTGYQTFKDAKFAGSFEGQSTVGVGVRAQLPFRVFETNGRLVVDVAHYW